MQENGDNASEEFDINTLNEEDYVQYINENGDMFTADDL